MVDWTDLGGREERRGGLSREAYRRLAWGPREAKVKRTEELPGEGLGKSEERSVEVRWGLPEDDALVAKLLELNGIPRWVAFEERFIILTEEEGEVLAALSYRMASKRLLLELLVADPWAEERFLATVLYEGAVALAREAGIGEVRARPTHYRNYPREVGYRWRRGGWWGSAAGPPFEVRGEFPAGGWPRVVALLGVVSVPYFRAFRDQNDC